MIALRLGLVAMLAGGCAEEAPPGPSAPRVEHLDAVSHLVRASMALRGIRPSLDEIAAVEEDPRWVEAIVDYYLDSPEFGTTIREMHAEQLLVGVDAAFYPAGFPARGALAGRDVQEINLRVMDAPLRLIEHVVMEDRPYHEIVTADYTITDEVSSTIFGTPYDPSGEEWQVTHYDDGRPHAGILSDSFLFTRHASTFSNRNRGRAAQVSRSLLCYDFLSREVEIDATIDLADEDAVANAIRENHACASCHQTLDPLAAHFAEMFPIYVPSDLMAFPFSVYDDRFAGIMRTAPNGYFGEPSGDLRDLGILIAEDPRFGLCTSRRFYAYLAQREPGEVPQETVARFYGEFVSSGMNAKALARAIVLSDEFRTAGPAADASDEEAEGIHGLFKARPEQLARTVQDLTGYRWETDLRFDYGIGNVGRLDLMTDSFFGFEVLAGGTDSSSVTRPATTQTATAALVMRSFAAHAAPYAVEQDFAVPAERRWLLRDVEPDTVDESAVRAQLVALQLRFFATRLEADAPEIDEAYALFAAALDESSDPRRAWTLTLYALLQDVRLTYY